MKTLIGILSTAFLAFAFTTSETENRLVTLDEFSKQIDSIGLVFDMPQGYEATTVKENRDLFYNFAIRNSSADFEVRYSIWALAPAMNEYDKCSKDPDCMMIHPDKFFPGRVQSNVLNMTGGQEPNIGAFPKGAVKDEFNADAGGSAFFEFNCGFGKGFKYGQMVYLHKDGVADVIITYLSNNKSTHSELMDKSFHALRFK